MDLLNFYQKTRSLRAYVRGYLINFLFFKNKSKNLRISFNFQMSGKIMFGNDVYIGSNVKMYKNVTIANGVRLGDNVELRNTSDNLITIGANCTINRGSIIIGQVEIGDNCLIAPLCVVVGSNHIFSDTKALIRTQGVKFKGVLVKQNVWLGAQVTILDGVTIGENSIIGAGSVVTKDIPPDCIAVGNPCKVVKRR